MFENDADALRETSVGTRSFQRNDAANDVGLPTSPAGSGVLVNSAPCRPPRTNAALPVVTTPTEIDGTLACSAGVTVTGNDNRVTGNVIAGERYVGGAGTAGGTKAYVLGDDNRLEGNRIGTSSAPARVT